MRIFDASPPTYSTVGVVELREPGHYMAESMADGRLQMASSRDVHFRILYFFDLDKPSEALT